MTKPNRKAVTRDKIMCAAMAQFAANGFEAASVQAIVEAAGVAHGTVFWHFGNKQALYIEVARWAGNQFYDAMRPHVECAGPPPTVTDLAQRQYDFLRGNRHIGRLSLAIVMEATGAHPELRPAMALFNRRVTDVWRHWAHRYAEAGLLDPKFDPETVGVLIATTLAGVNVGAFIHDDDATRYFEHVTRIFETGCLKRPGADGVVFVADAPRPTRRLAVLDAPKDIRIPNAPAVARG